MELVGKVDLSQANHLLGVPGLSPLDVDDDDDGEIFIGIRPKSSPLPRRRSSSTEEDLELELPLSGSRRVSFADAKGLNLVQVKEFGSWDVPRLPGYELAESEGGDAEEFFICPLTFSIPWTTEELFTRVREKKAELETLEILPGTTIVRGVVRVLNISFNKTVYIRTSLDSWCSHFDLLAEYLPGSSDSETDCFSFKLTLVPPYGKDGAKVDFCLRYETSAGIYWANNDNKNYVLLCQHRTKAKKENAPETKRSCLKTPSTSFSIVDPTTDEFSAGRRPSDVSSHGPIISTAICNDPFETPEEREHKAQMESRHNSSRRSHRKAERLARVSNYFVQRNGGEKEGSPVSVKDALGRKCTDVQSENSPIVCEASETPNPTPVEVCSSDSELVIHQSRNEVPDEDPHIGKPPKSCSTLTDNRDDGINSEEHQIVGPESPSREENTGSNDSFNSILEAPQNPVKIENSISTFEGTSGLHQTEQTSSSQHVLKKSLHLGGEAPEGDQTFDIQSETTAGRWTEEVIVSPSSPLVQLCQMVSGQFGEGTEESTTKGGDKDKGDHDKESKVLTTDSTSKEDPLFGNHTDKDSKNAKNLFHSCCEREPKSCKDFTPRREAKTHGEPLKETRERDLCQTSISFIHPSSLLPHYPHASVTLQLADNQDRMSIHHTTDTQLSTGNRVNSVELTAEADINEDDTTCASIKDENTGMEFNSKQEESVCLSELTKNWEMMVEEEEINILMSDQEANQKVTDECTAMEVSQKEHVKEIYSEGSANGSSSENRESVRRESVQESRTGNQTEHFSSYVQEMKQIEGEKDQERQENLKSEERPPSKEDDLISKILHVLEEVKIDLKDEGYVDFQLEDLKKDKHIKQEFPGKMRETPNEDFGTLGAEPCVMIEDRECDEACPGERLHDDTSAVDNEPNVHDEENTQYQNEEEVQPNMESEGLVVDGEDSDHWCQDSSSAESDSDDEVELYMHCLRAVSAVERSGDASFTLTKRSSGSRSKLHTTPMPSISESVDEELHLPTLREEHPQVGTDSSTAQTPSGRLERSEKRAWGGDTFSCSNISKMLVYPSLLVVFSVVAYHYDFMACFGLYLISVVWLCCQEEKQTKKDHKQIG